MSRKREFFFSGTTRTHAPVVKPFLEFPITTNRIFHIKDIMGFALNGLIKSLEIGLKEIQLQNFLFLS